MTQHRNVPIATAAAPAADGSTALGGARWTMPLFTRNQLWVLLGITLLAAFLRLFQLEVWSFWVDEGHTWRDITLPLWGEGGFFESARARYPVAYLLLRGLVESGVLPLTGEGWLRLPFAFFGIVTVPLVALLGLALVGRRAALLAALFLAVNPWHIYWSQNARAYVLMMLLGTAAAGVFYVGAERRSWPIVTSGILLAVLAGLTHPTAFLLLGMFLVYQLLRRSRTPKRLFVTGAVLGLAFLLLLPQALTLVPAARDFTRAKPDASLLHLLETTAFFFRLPLLAIAIVGAWLAFHCRSRSSAFFVACWAFVPLLVLGATGISVVKTTARYALCALPAFMLLAGLASVRLGEYLDKVLESRGSWGRRLAVGLLPCLLLLDMLGYDYLYFTSQQGDRPRWREAARDAVRSVEPDRKLAVLTTNEPSLNYYLRPMCYADIRREAKSYPHRNVVPLTPWLVEAAGGGESFLLGEMARARTEGRELFVIVTEPELREIDKDRTLDRSLRRLFHQVQRYPAWHGPKDQTILVYYYEQPRR